MAKEFEIEGIDEIDEKILSVIKDDARMSYSDIAEKVGVTRVSVKNRMNLLQEKGIIQGYKTNPFSEKCP